MPGATVRASVRASLYNYEVHNTGTQRIAAFRVNYANAYAFEVPPGWQYTSTGDVFCAFTDREWEMIRPGGKARFAFRVTSKGAVLGHVAAAVETESGATIALPNLWGPVPEPPGHALAVAATLAVLAVLYAGGLLLQSRRGTRVSAP